MSNIINEELEEELERVRIEVKESRKFPNSHGHGYDLGYRDALLYIKSILENNSK